MEMNSVFIGCLIGSIIGTILGRIFVDKFM